MKRTQTIRRGLLGLLALLLVMVIGFYHQSSVEAGELNISVKPILPENQTNKSLKYFDLKVTPGQHQTIELEVENVADHDVTVLIYPTTATTDGNGRIDYKNIKAPVNATMKYPFAEIATVAERTVLSANEVCKIPIELAIPDESFDGMILGGLYIKQEEDEEETDDSEETEGKIEITHSFSYELTVKLTENDTPITPELELLDARAGRYEAQNVMQGNLQNPQPDILSQLKVSAKVYKKGSSTPLYTNESAGINLAPNSNFYYSVPLKELKNGEEKNVAVQAGKYTFEVTASNDKGEWKLSTDFEVTKEEAAALNDEATEELAYPVNYVLWIAVGVGAFVVVLALVVTIVLLRRKKSSGKKKSAKGGKSKKKTNRKARK